MDAKAVAVAARLSDFDRADGALEVPEEYSGRPLFGLRRLVVVAFFRLLIGTASVVIRVLDPMHPYRVFIEGEIVKHRLLLGSVVVPLKGRRMPDKLRRALWIVVAILALGELIGSVPGVGLTDLLMGDKPLHPLFRLGVSHHENNLDLVRLFRHH